MRAFTPNLYGIPAERPLGSRGKLKHEIVDDAPVLIKLPKIDFVDGNVNKPVAIHPIIGKWPIFAFGNSDGDLQILQRTWAGPGKCFCGYVHHTDTEREWVYDRGSSIGELNKGLDEAQEKGWGLVDMKKRLESNLPSQLKGRLGGAQIQARASSVWKWSGI